MKNLGSIGLSFLSQDDLLGWLKQYTETPETIYDKAMDDMMGASGIKGSDHRLFDGGHGPIDAWESVRNASDTDTLAQEVIGYVSAMFKDMSTTMGMPFATLDKEAFYNFNEKFVSTIPYVDKNTLKYMASYDTLEILVSVLGIASALYFLKRDDIKSLSRILGSMAIITLLEANLLLGISVILLAAYAFMYKKNDLDKKEFGKGMAVSATACIVFSTLGVEISVGLIISLLAIKLIKKRSITTKEIQKKLYLLCNNQKELIPLMAGVNQQYADIYGNYTDINSNADDIADITENKLSKRQSTLEKLSKMKDYDGK